MRKIYLLSFLLLVLVFFSSCLPQGWSELPTLLNSKEEDKIFMLNKFIITDLIVMDTSDGKIDENLDTFEIKTQLRSDFKNVSLTDIQINVISSLRIASLNYNTRILDNKSFIVEYASGPNIENYISGKDIVKLKFLSPYTFLGDEQFIIELETPNHSPQYIYVVVPPLLNKKTTIIE
jgi:hypothetical protein